MNTKERRPQQGAAPSINAPSVRPAPVNVPEARVLAVFTGNDGSPRVRIACPYCTVTTGAGRNLRRTPGTHEHGTGDGSPGVWLAHCLDIPANETRRYYIDPAKAVTV